MIDRRRFLESAALAAVPMRVLGQAAADQTYRYTLVDGGWEIVDGDGAFNRPLPPSRSRDKISRSERLVVWAGDRPELRFSVVATRAANFADLRFGMGDQRLTEFRNVKARYKSGAYEYEAPYGGCKLRLGIVPAVNFEGLIVKAELPPGVKFFFEISPGATPTEAGGFYLKGETVKRELYGASSAPLEFRQEGGWLRASPSRPESTVYLWIASDQPDSGEVRECAESPGRVYDQCVQQLAELSRRLEVRTPDPYLDAVVAEQNLALDRAWHEVTMMHGVFSWHVALAGWRSLYGNTVLGWHDRVQAHARSFFDVQVKTPELPPRVPPERQVFGEAPACRGAIPGYLTRKSYFYNMGEVLLDMVMYDWLWTGDLDFMARSFDSIADKLTWQDRCLDADGDGLYENWLNAWNTDSKWHNGGGCIISSAYTWRASQTMAEVARRLGRDARPFGERATKIRKACGEQLWIASKGLFAEYKDRLGHQRLHEAPDQSSVYTPIDVGFCDDFQAYQMLRFTEYAIPNVRGLARGGKLLWSSNWLPPLYSTHGLYPNETIHTMLCYFRLGLADQAYELLKGLESGPFMGPCPGNIGVLENPDGTAGGHIWFSDVTSMFQRTMVEGLFGVRMNAPEGMVTVQPAFPRDWEKASMKGPVASVEYARTGASERLAVSTARKLKYRVRLRARSADVQSVTVNGKRAEFRFEEGVASAWVVCDVAETDRAEIVVRYGAAPLPVLHAPSVGAVGEEFSASVEHGAIAGVRDPQRVLSQPRIEGARCAAELRGEPGWHTFFILSGKVWLPVDFELRPPLEVVEARLAGDRCTCAIRNNSQAPRWVRGKIALGRAEKTVEVTVPALGSAPVEIDAADRTPGTNAIALTGISFRGVVTGALVDWKAPLAPGAAHTVPLAGLYNQDLATLHDQRYVAPATPNYTMTVEANGRPWWLNRARKPEVRLDALKAAKGRLVSAIGVPFDIAETGPNACFVSMYENFPRRLTIPLGREARKIYFLLAVSTNQMQSRIENARVTVNHAGGRRLLALVNPENIDDWLMEPFALGGQTQPFGPGTHGHIVDVDLGRSAPVESVEVECLSNEVLCGVVGVTVVETAK